MLDEPYEVVTIPATLDTAESLGTRMKYWVRIGGGSERWLLKIPRKGTGEHWAEKIVAEIGNLIGVDCAQVELARYTEDVVFGAGTGDRLDDGQAYRNRPDQLGTICKSFGREEHDEEKRFLFAFHGVGALQFVVDGYDIERKFGQKDHNLKNIIGGMAEVMAVKSDDPMPRWRDAFEKLASYALLDGLVGNTDRHHENWMIAYVDEHEDDHEVTLDVFTEVLPSFDHASSLGRELDDEKRRRILESDGIRRYLKRGKGGVYVNSRRKKAPSPLRLARLLCRWKPEFTAGTLNRINELSEPEIRTAIERVPGEFMSDIAKEFAFQVITTSKHELLRSTP